MLRLRGTDLSSFNGEVVLLTFISGKYFFNLEAVVVLAVRIVLPVADVNAVIVHVQQGLHDRCDREVVVRIGEKEATTAVGIIDDDYVSFNLLVVRLHHFDQSSFRS